MAQLVYTLCSLTALGCALLLLRAFKKTGSRLLLWSGLCFVGLALNHALIFIDLVVVPQVDLYVWRTLPAVLGMAALIYGLIWEAE